MKKRDRLYTGPSPTTIYLRYAALERLVQSVEKTTPEMIHHEMFDTLVMLSKERINKLYALLAAGKKKSVLATLKGERPAKSKPGVVHRAELLKKQRRKKLRSRKAKNSQKA